jgi:hypothetical protein
MVAKQTTDFNPDWIRMIVLLVTELVKLRHQLVAVQFEFPQVSKP